MAIEGIELPRRWELNQCVGSSSLGYTERSLGLPVCADAPGFVELLEVDDDQVGFNLQELVKTLEPGEWQSNYGPLLGRLSEDWGVYQKRTLVIITWNDAAEDDGYHYNFYIEVPHHDAKPRRWSRCASVENTDAPPLELWPTELKLYFSADSEIARLNMPGLAVEPVFHRLTADWRGHHTGALVMVTKNEDDTCNYAVIANRLR